MCIADLGRLKIATEVAPANLGLIADLAEAARRGFVSGMDLGLVIAAVVSPSRAWSFWSHSPSGLGLRDLGLLDNDDENHQ